MVLLHLNPPKLPGTFGITPTPTNYAAGAGISAAPSTSAPPILGNHAVSVAPVALNPFHVAFAKNSSPKWSTPSTTATLDLMGNHAVQAAPLAISMTMPAPVRSGQVDVASRNSFQVEKVDPPVPSVNPAASAPELLASVFPEVRSDLQVTPLATQLHAVVGSSLINYHLKWQLVELAKHNPIDWEILVGLYLQESGVRPFEIGCKGGHNDWRLDLRRLDRIGKNETQNIETWHSPPPDSMGWSLCQLISIDTANRRALEHAIQEWAVDANTEWVTRILKKAGWYTGTYRTYDWEVMNNILKMPYGEERDEKMAQAKEESPRFFEECVKDPKCGARRYMKRHIWSEEDDPDSEYDDVYEVCATCVNHTEHEEFPRSPPRKRGVKSNMATGPGQPTQFHGVPLEERATDSKGNRLPWSLEYHEDHPNARGQKRHAEEKGPFGKSTRRKGSSRTRTATPARKENPTLDGFEKALKHDAQLAAEQQESNASARAQNDGNVAPRNTPSHTKEPTQMIIYGYAPSRCYAAIDRYEKMSGGMVCEDYPREPPSELQKYQTPFSASRSVHSRSRTKQEIAMANKYAGGSSWIKLTCDSAEAAARAIESSPCQVYGHWVYAELYNGKGPEFDQPIPITEEDRREGPFNSPRPPRKPSQTLSAAFSQHATTQKRATSTLPRNFTSQADTPPAHEASSLSPSTASSATATGPEYPNLRNRHLTQPVQSTATSTSREIAPGIPRYILRPASEAFLPQPTWWERQLQWLGAQGLIPTDFIGDGLPIMENGEFDWAKASWYWRICYWLDSHVGTDICGLKEN